MTIKNYGVWVGTPTHYNPPPPSDRTPHLDLQFRDTIGSYFANINVESGGGPDQRLVFWSPKSLPSKLTSQLLHLKPGYHAIDQSSDLALDYLHSGIVDIASGKVLDYLPEGSQAVAPTILDTVEPILKRAIEEHAKIFVFGSEYINPPRRSKPGVKGIHEVHMNQGSGGSHSNDNGGKQDGALLIYFQDQGNAGSGEWEGVFLAFASQASQTDEDGMPIDGSPDLAEVIQGGASGNNGTNGNDGDDRDE